MKQGIAGRIAGAFLQSKLSLLLMIVFLLVGAYSIALIPREEDPQITVPAADIFLSMPGASPKEVETKIIAPLERVISNVKGVEHLYSTSMNGQGMLTVQFYVGENVENSLVKLYNEIMKHMDEMPQGVSMPLIKTRSIDDVPVLSMTLWSKKSSDYIILQQAELIRSEIKKIPHVTGIKLLGGRAKQVRVILDKNKMAGMNQDMTSIANYLQGANMQMESGNAYRNNEVYQVETGNFLHSAEEISHLIVGMNGQSPVYLSDIATVSEGPAVPTSYVSYEGIPAVTIAVSKQQGTDAKKLSVQILNKVKKMEAEQIAPDIHVAVTRNYGESASEKVSELLLHLLGAIFAVTLFVMLAMGWRGGLVVFLSVPVTFALTLFAYYFMDYTLNRITLFALVFVTGIVVDDSIIVAENMHRHFKMKYASMREAALYAINEVGNPTILATLTVIAAVLPMAFVSGLMGPYMSPMPIGATIAMSFSLLIALTLTPYLGFIFLRTKEQKLAEKLIKDRDHKLTAATCEANAEYDAMETAFTGSRPGEKLEECSIKEYRVEDTKIYHMYRRIINPMLEKRSYRWIFMLTTVFLLIASISLFFFKVVPVKMLPFDNKNEIQVVIDMPEGTPLEQANAVAQEIGIYLGKQKYVDNYQTYAGTSAPISFNGLMRHYDLRRGDNVADIQVNLVNKNDRSVDSHDIAKALRPGIQKIGKRMNANVKIVEVPPGPPVLSTMVAEVYGPSKDVRLSIAKQIKAQMEKEKGVVDVDILYEYPQPEMLFSIDRDKAMKLGVIPAQISDNLNAAVSGRMAGVLHQDNYLQPIPIMLKLKESDKSSSDELKSLPIRNQMGKVVSLGDLTTLNMQTKKPSIMRKDQMEVIEVTAELAGNLESPIYTILNMEKGISNISVPNGYKLNILNNGQPKYEDNYTVKWDGEWQITYDVFRDLGIAFLVAILIIYLLIVGWFQDFLVPIVMLSAIPLSLIGIVIGHWLMNIYFSATSMIGFIALAGVMVRNSILLIDFINIRLKEGFPLKQSIIEAGAVRTLPILLTAGTVVLGAIVILFDPLFQGLAISLMGGTITSTVLTLIVVPLLYFKMLKGKRV
ncbi:MAG: efflux RND transporter permease subunit [Bacteroidaceae bacterium]